MPSCEAHQGQLLDYLYDLLEGEERTALLSHLETCGDCRAALDRAKWEQNLLATAARLAVPAVRFEAPSAQPVEAAPVLLPMPDRKPARRWRHLLVAAAVLIALGIPGWLIGRSVSDYNAARRSVDQGEQAVAQANEKLTKIESD